MYTHGRLVAIVPRTLYGITCELKYECCKTHSPAELDLYCTRSMLSTSARCAHEAAYTERSGVPFAEGGGVDVFEAVSNLVVVNKGVPGLRRGRLISVEAELVVEDISAGS